MQFFFVLETIMDVIFFLDLVANFFTAVNWRGQLVTQRCQIAKIYLRFDWFGGAGRVIGYLSSKCSLCDFLIRTFSLCFISFAI